MCSRQLWNGPVLAAACAVWEALTPLRLPADLTGKRTFFECSGVFQMALCCCAEALGWPLLNATSSSKQVVDHGFRLSSEALLARLSDCTALVHCRAIIQVLGDVAGKDSIVQAIQI